MLQHVTASQVPTPLRQHVRATANILEEVMRRKGRQLQVVSYT